LKAAAVKADSDNVVVGVRIRPFNSIELAEKNVEPAFKKVGKQMIRECHQNELAGVQGKEYVYDHVFGPKNNTSDVYERLAKPLIEKSMEGFNGTIFAYGQTSSGKTHTLMGNDSDPGITLRAIDAVFEQIDSIENTQFLVRISYIEIYNEEIGDLLEPVRKGSSRSLRIKDDKKKGPIVEDLTEERVTNAEDARRLIKKGEGNRSYGSTAMNEQSSRSHVLFKMVVESREVDAKSAADQVTMFIDGWSKDRPPVKEAAINLVDLAGSERRGKTGATGQRAKEGNAINQSLLTLGTVISKLSEGARGAHIPYRDSKLTRLLQMSLGGNAKTAMIAAISPADRNRDETTSTLRYASRAKQIVNHAKKNVIEDDESELVKAQNEIEKLKEELANAQSNPKVSEEAVKQAAEAEEKLSYLNKVVILSNKLAQAQKNLGNKDAAKEIEKDIRSVVSNKRRAQSIYGKHLGMINQLPSKDQERLRKLDQKAAMGSFDEGNEEDEEEEDFDSKQLKEAEEKITNLQSEVIEVKMDMQQLEDDKAELKASLQTEKNKVISCENEMKVLHRDLDKYVKNYDESVLEVKSVQERLKDSEHALHKSETESNELTSEMSSLKTQLDQLSQALDAKELKMAELGVEHDNKVKGFVQTAKERLGAHQATLETAKEELEKEKALRRDSEAALSESKRSIADKDFQVQHLKREYESAEGAIKHLQKERDETRLETEDLTKRLHGDIEVAQGRTSELMDELSQVKNELMGVNMSYESLKVSNESLVQKYDIAREELREIKTVSEDFKREANRNTEELKRENNDLKQQVTSLKTSKTAEIDMLKSRMAELTKAVEEERDLKDKQRKRAQDALDSLDSVKTDSVIKADKASAEVAALQGDLASATESLAAVKESANRESSRFAAEIESLANELDEEKRRVSTATQEKNRLAADSDTVKRKIDRLTAELDNANTNLNLKSEGFDELSREVRSLKRQLELGNEKVEDSTRRSELAEGKLDAAETAKDALTHELNDALRLHSDCLKEVGSMKKVVQNLKDDLNETDNVSADLRAKIKEGEELAVEKEKVVSARDQKIVELTGELAKLREFEDSHDFLENKMKKLEAELDRSMGEIASSKKAQLQAESAFTEQMLKAQRFEDQSSSLRADLDVIKTETKTLRDTLQSTRATNVAKDEAVDAANRKAEIAMSGKQAIEKELEELRGSIVSVGKAKRLAETESLAARRECDGVTIELEELKNKVRRLESDLEEARSSVDVGEEVAVLRNQLSMMKRQMIGSEDGFEDEDDMGGPGSPRKKRLNESAMLENKREKEAYENIISNLRGELQRESDIRKGLISDLNGAKREAAVAASVHGDLDEAKQKIRRLEEEIANCEVEISRAKRNELNALAVSSEAERNLGRKVDDDVIMSAELKEAHEQINLERSRADRYAKDLAEAERRAALLQASKSKAETGLESLSQQSDQKTRALNALKVGEEETLNKLGEIQGKLEDVVQRNEYLENAIEEVHSERIFVKNELERWKEVAAVAQSELQKEDHEVGEMDEKIVNLMEDLRLATEFKEQQAGIIESLKEEIQRVRKSLNDNGSLKAGNEIMMLRKELETTMNDWGEAERKRRDREDRLVELKTSLVSEQEKSSLLVTQLKLVEDQLSLVREELAVYRQIDVYETSVKREKSWTGGRKRMGGGGGTARKGEKDLSFQSSGKPNLSLSLMRTPEKDGGGGRGEWQGGLGLSSPMSFAGVPDSPEVVKGKNKVGGSEGGGGGGGGGGGEGGNDSKEDSDDDDAMPFSKNQLDQAKRYLLERQKRTGRGLNRSFR
ncbi:hypothetical protein TrRE_jg4309, partial [Triparma retinervis]